MYCPRDQLRIYLISYVNSINQSNELLSGINELDKALDDLLECRTESNVLHEK